MKKKREKLDIKKIQYCMMNPNTDQDMKKMLQAVISKKILKKLEREQIKHTQIKQ